MTDPLALVAEMEARLQGTKEALARIDQALRLRPSAQGALAACLDGDDQRAAELLAGLDDAQLYAIEGAASGLAIHASRLRKPPGDEQDGPAAAGRRVSVDEYERLLAADEQTAARVERCRCGVAITRDGDHWTHIGDADPFHFPEPARCPAQTGPVWKADGEPCGCTLDDGHDGDHQCPCGAWWVDSVRRDRDDERAADEQPQPARVLSRADLAAELREAGAKLDAMQVRAETAEAKVTALKAERDHHKARLLDALGIAPVRDWDDIVNAARGLRADRDAQQRLAIKAEAMLSEGRKQVERWRYHQDRRRAADEIAPILGIDLRDRTDDPDAWRP